MALAGRGRTFPARGCKTHVEWRYSCLVFVAFPIQCAKVIEGSSLAQCYAGLQQVAGPMECFTRRVVKAGDGRSRHRRSPI